MAGIVRSGRGLARQNMTGLSHHPDQCYIDRPSHSPVPMWVRRLPPPLPVAIHSPSLPPSLCLLVEHRIIGRFAARSVLRRLTVAICAICFFQVGILAALR